MIEYAPLQLYCSALIFAPENSIVRRQFKKVYPGLDPKEIDSGRKLECGAADARGPFEQRHVSSLLT